MNEGQIVQIAIESLASTGWGVGTLEVDGHKRPVFVQYTCPGDRIKAKITEHSKKYYKADLYEIIKPSHLRLESRCKHYGICGGCDLLHMDYEAQVEYKKRFVEFMFKSLYQGEIKVITGEPDHYRKRIRIFSDQGKVGFKRARSSEIVDIKECMLIDEDFLEHFEEFRKQPGEYAMAIDEEGVATWDVRDKLDLYQLEKGKVPVCSYDLNGKHIQYTPSCFTQAHLDLNVKLVNTVMEHIQAKRPKTIVELFSGIGNFTSQLEKFKVLAVEVDYVCYYFAQVNAKQAKHLLKDVYEFLDTEDKQYDLVLLDPPRDGLKEGYATKIAGLTSKVVYVSCDAKALKLNVKEFMEQGFKLTHLTMVDMYPHTHHVELVAVLEK